jgi:hypothetical protein
MSPALGSARRDQTVQIRLFRQPLWNQIGSETVAITECVKRMIDAEG